MYLSLHSGAGIPFEFKFGFIWVFVLMGMRSPFSFFHLGFLGEDLQNVRSVVCMSLVSLCWRVRICCTVEHEIVSASFW